MLATEQGRLRAVLRRLASKRRRRIDRALLVQALMALAHAESRPAPLGNPPSRESLT